MVNYFKKRKLRKQLENEGVLQPKPSLGYKYRESKIGKAQHSAYGFIDYLGKEGKPTGKGRKGKRKNPFGRIKDRSLFEGGFF